MRVGMCVARESDENAFPGPEECAEGGRPSPRSLGDIIREIGFGVFQILPREKHPRAYVIGRFFGRNRISIPKEVSARRSNYAVYMPLRNRERIRRTLCVCVRVFREILIKEYKYSRLGREKKKKKLSFESRNNRLLSDFKFTKSITTTRS